MPRNVRNFWVEATIDGRATRLESGPVSKDGGIQLRILMRERGCISDTEVNIEGKVMHDGRLLLMIDHDTRDEYGYKQSKRLADIITDR